MTQQVNRPAERRRWETFPSVAEKVVVVETPSLCCFECVRGRKSNPRVCLNHC